MALINCPECSKEISDKVKNCPHCGYPLKSKGKTLKSKKTLIISIGIIAVIAIAGLSILALNNSKQAKAQAFNQAKMETETNALFKDVVNKITSTGKDSTDACAIVLEAWSKSLRWDFNKVFNYMYSGDVKNHEISGVGMDKDGFSSFSYGSVAADMNSFNGRLNTLVGEKDFLDKNFEKIKQLKRDGHEKEIDAIVNYYNACMDLYKAATSPSGNELNYSSNLVKMKSEFDSRKTQAEMLVK